MNKMQCVILNNEIGWSTRMKLRTNYIMTRGTEKLIWIRIIQNGKDKDMVIF